jgi:putative aldouronate transport system permease protein
VVEDRSFGRRAFIIINITWLIIFSVICLFPYIHIIALSLSSSSAATAGEVVIWPVDITFKSYEFLVGKSQFIRSFLISMERVALGLIVNMGLVILIAYPLSKENRRFKSRSVYVWFFVFTMLFNGGLIPTYLTVKTLGMIDSIWALILPTAVQVFSVTIMLNFLRGLPKELEESAFIDGAGHFTFLFRIALPLSLPALMTLSLFSIVFHWNSWFDGLIYINDDTNYPLQTFIQKSIVTDTLQFMRSNRASVMKAISTRTVRAAQILVSSVPVLIAYPFIQRYFMSGIVLGSVKE